MHRGQNDRAGTSRATTPRDARPSPFLSATWALAGVALGASTARVLVRVAAAGTAVPGATRPEDVLLAGLAWLGVLLAGWLALGSSLALLALVPGSAGRLAGAVAVRVTPLAVRKSLTLVLGASVGSIALPPALVSSAGSTPVSVSAPDGPATTPSPGYVASRPAPAAPGAADVPAASPGFAVSDPRPPAPLPGPGFRPTAPTPVADAQVGRLLSPNPRPSSSEHGLVTVRRGDSLWSVVARHLGSDASDADVAREWPRWYAVNREVIGTDPDLLVPGQQLRPPGGVDRAPVGSTAASATRGATR